MTGTNAKVGQSTRGLSCCGRPMFYVDSGIWECTHCHCHVISENRVATQVNRCGSH